MTVITDSKDVNSNPVDELVGSLQSYELDLPKISKSKSITLKSVDDVKVGGFDDELSVRISALKSYCMMLCMLLCMTLCMT